MGQPTARERIGILFQEGTFQEIGRLITHRARGFGMADKVIPADGIVVGTGYVDGRQVVTFSQDFTVSAGTLGEMHAQKMVDVMHYALKMGIPLVALRTLAVHAFRKVWMRSPGMEGFLSQCSSFRWCRRLQ